MRFLHIKKEGWLIGRGFTKNTLKFFGLPLISMEKILIDVDSRGIARLLMKYKILNKKIKENIIQKANLGGNHYMQINLGKFIATQPNIEDKIRKLVKNLSHQNKREVLTMIDRLRENYINNLELVPPLSTYEQEEMQRLYSDFFSKIHKLSESKYFYDKYFLPVDRFDVSVFFHKHSLASFEPQTLTHMKQKDIIDVGGFIGDSVLVLQEFTDKTIHTFEAAKDNFEILKKTLKMNNVTRAKAINKGLGSKTETLQISLDGSGSSFAHAYKTKSETCEIITLDEYVSENNVQVGFIKVDIEGFEMEFLKGALETIKTQKPAMLISIYHQPSDFFDIKPFLESLNLGYTFKIVKPFDFSISMDTALFCEVP